ncbi:hypothetical protein KR074_007552 [Drosophila pseudoananassae]|nr:hypothetical protein KR074_007552 [Drosophila pseudoananassae]
MYSLLATLLLLTILFRISHEKDDFSTPSPAWLEYQRERFGVLPPVSSTNTPIMNVATPKVETTSRRHSSHTPENESQETGDKESTEQPPEEGGIELPSMGGFLKFLKTLQNTWAKKSALTFDKKFKLLQNLRDNLMKLIEQQFAVLWQPPEQKRRRRRGLLDSSEIDFPPEAAIMTINFLTFAVFLIKLVMVR